MILSDIDIKCFLEEGNIQILPKWHEKDIRPTGIRLHLNDEILIPNSDVIIDLEHFEDNSTAFRRENILKEGYLLKPQEFVLASSVEKIQTRENLVCFIDGRSTIARMGLFVHCASTTFDNIHDESRNVVFELYNCGKFTIHLRYNAAVALLSFTLLNSPIYQQSQDQYKNQSSALPPNLSFKINKNE